MIPQQDWRWFGHPGHFICAQDCRFHLCTLVGDVLVSTVGELLPDSGSWDIYAEQKGVTLRGRGDARRADFLDRVGYVEIGYGRKYETMAFRAGAPCVLPECGCGLPVISGMELTSRAANDAGTAAANHYEVCFLASEQPITMGEHGYETLESADSNERGSR